MYRLTPLIQKYNLLPIADVEMEPNCCLYPDQLEEKRKRHQERKKQIYDEIQRKANDLVELQHEVFMALGGKPTEEITSLPTNQSLDDQYPNLWYKIFCKYTEESSLTDEEKMELFGTMIEEYNNTGWYGDGDHLRMRNKGSLLSRYGDAALAELENENRKLLQLTGIIEYPYVDKEGNIVFNLTNEFLMYIRELFEDQNFWRDWCFSKRRYFEKTCWGHWKDLADDDDFKNFVLSNKAWEWTPTFETVILFFGGFIPFYKKWRRAL